ncbi:uncharacterized protein N7473_006190 [Penicillium subrubescens]|uniref:uncharacterized protein n=1 Tax=Penicillium subrubescens TaxID=1316194 RepID=UPI0025452308|nr:uncharacterized protein N7473_006190 [Penicillium subrubescens]KAJ5896791.1 hypothetical protein N7473_006190 [Penicillium subrubescens]
MLQKKRKIGSDAPSDHFGVEIERGNPSPEAINSHRTHPGRFAGPKQNFLRSSHRHAQDQGAALQPRWFIKDYIDRKRAMTKDKEIADDAPRDGPLLIGWYDDEGQEVTELNETKENLAKMVIEMWARSKTESGQQRTAFYAQKWRDVVRRRQLDQDLRVAQAPTFVLVLLSNETLSMAIPSESPKSPGSGRTQSHVRVEFGHEIHLIESSSSENNASENDKRSSIEQTSMSPRKEPSKNRPDPIEPAKGILKPPKEKFPEEPNPIREGVAPLKNTDLKGVPSGARWTKIDRRLVSPAALEAGNERFEEQADYVVVLRVLKKEEIQEYALRTTELREARKDALKSKTGSPSRESRVDGSRGRRRRREGSLSPDFDRSHSISQTNSASGSREGTPQDFEGSSQSREDIKYRITGVHSHSPPRSRPDGSWRSPNNRGSGDWASEPGSRRPSRRKNISIRFNNGYSDSEISELEIEVPESHYGSNAYGAFHRRRQSIGHDPWNISDDETQYEETRSLSTESRDTLSWFWVCQIDVIPGYLATPWTTQFSTECCVGAIAVILEAIGMLTEFSQPVYLDTPCHPRGLDWMRSGLSTYPPYGVSANHHHGTVISGGYNTKIFPGFRAPLFQIELLRHYGFQVDRHQPSDAANLRARLTELMALDSWLSYCGRQPEICGHGPPSDLSISVVGVGDLLYTMPKLIERTMESFKFEFTNLERTAIDGGHQIVQQIAGNLLDTLGWKVEGLSPGEKLFALVAMLRASKMALCIVQGTDTSSLREILLNDVQVHLV